jgi:hypothetical protein
MVVAGAERFLKGCFVLSQGVANRCGNEMKGYLLLNKFNWLSPVLTTNDDF